jgi:hypothetical protein|tara:strand:+ start:28583 stop:28792 length:210 start_codon:yes stop_codon:yes gene_type:complete
MTTLSPNVENFLNQQPIGHFIGGEFVQPAGQERIAVLDPATAKEITSVLKGDAQFVDGGHVEWDLFGEL